MSKLIVHPVSTSSERSQFLRLPWDLHRNDPNWVPPLRVSQKELVGYKRHPFSEDAELQTFLALQDGKPVGRIAAIVNHAHNRRHEDRKGFFGFFESVNDPQVAHELFDAVQGWMRERQLNCLRGPTSPSLHYECGLLVDGFDTPPTIMIPYNPPYYQQLLESYGFHKAQDLYSLKLPLREGELEQVLNQKATTIADTVLDRFNVQLRSMNPSHFEKEVQTFFHIYNQSMEKTWGFVPIPEKEIHHLSKSLKYLIVPELTSIAEVDGKPVGIVFLLPDYNPRIKAIDGRLFPFGILRLLWRKRTIKRVRIIAANVLPEYQSWGLGVALLIRLIPTVRAQGLEEAEFSWVAESNHLSKASLERAGATISKTHRIYDYDFPEDPEA